MKVLDVLKKIEELAPCELAESWDNVGLLVGDKENNVRTVLCALDITDEVIQEAVDVGAELIVAHHPMIFTSVSKVTQEDLIGRKIIKLVQNNISAICMHTNLDSAVGGVNDCLANTLNLRNLDDLPVGEKETLGRVGELENEMKFSDFLVYTKEKLKAGGLRYHKGNEYVKKVALIGGSGGKHIDKAKLMGADTFLTSEISYDIFQKAHDLEMNVIDAGHYPTENVVTPKLCKLLSDLDVNVLESKHKDIILFI